MGGASPRSAKRRPDTTARLGVAPPEPLRLLADNAPRSAAGSAEFAVTVPHGARRLTVDVFDRFGEKVRSVAAETDPAEGPRTVVWDGTDDRGPDPEATDYLVRVTVDGHSESQIIHLTS